MEEHEKLEKIIYDTLSGQYGDFSMPYDAANAIIAAGWRPPARGVTNHQKAMNLDEDIELIEALRAIIDSHPNPLECEKHADDDTVSCGWKIAYTQVVQQIGEGKAA